jgi:hypothetical protein
MATTLEMLEERVRAVVSETWPDLPEARVAEVELDVERLAEALRGEFGLDPEQALSEAREAFVQALVPAQGGLAGWVVILEAEEETQLARGQLHLFDTSPDSPGEHLAGAVTNLRLTDGIESLELGEYRLRFEENGETRQVQVVSPQDTIMPDTVALAFLDEGLPIPVSELSAGD